MGGPGHRGVRQPNPLLVVLHHDPLDPTPRDAGACEGTAGASPTVGVRCDNSTADLGGAIDGLLEQQIELDIDALEGMTGRAFSDDEAEEIRTKQRRAYLWTFLVSGLSHPTSVRIVDELTSTGVGKLVTAEALSAQRPS